MRSNLIIVESPAKCRKIESYLGLGYHCIATCGHIRELPGIDALNMDDGFVPTYTPMDAKAVIIKRLRNAILAADVIFLATDDDREGEAIAWHICDHFNLPINTTARIVFHEITAIAIQSAIRSPIKLNMDLVRSQQARQIVDLLIGYTLSPTLWANVPCKKGVTLSAGRCQNPALRLIYDNQKEVDANPGDIIYITTGLFTNSLLEFTLNRTWKTAEESKICMETCARHIRNKTGFIIQPMQPPKNIVDSPPAPFTTSTLQQAASSECHLSPTQIMSLAQQLYEDGHITYMRTDSTVLSATFCAEADSYIHSQKNLKTGIKSETNPEADTKSTSTPVRAHEAIRPVYARISSLTYKDPNINNLYALIWRRAIGSRMSASITQRFELQISVEDNVANNESLLFVRTENIIQEYGWRRLTSVASIVHRPSQLSQLRTGISSFPCNILSTAALHGQRRHYTEAGLIQALEKKGIGRPATYASLVQVLQTRNYVTCVTKIPARPFDCVEYLLDGRPDNCVITTEEVRRKLGSESRCLVIQPLGTAVIEYLVANHELFCDYTYTNQMEAQLDVLATSSDTGSLYTDICYGCCAQLDKDKCKKETHEELLEEDDGPTILALSSTLSVRNNKNGRGWYVMKTKHKRKPIFYSLEAFPKDPLLCLRSELKQWVYKTYPTLK